MIIITGLMAVLASVFVPIIYSFTGRTRRRINEIETEKYGTPGERRKQARRSRQKTKQSGRVQSFVKTIDDTLHGAGIYFDANRFAVIWVVTIAVIPTLLSILNVKTAYCVAVSAVICVTPLVYIKIRRKKRTERFEEQLIDAIDILNSALKAGYSFQGALQTVYKSSDDPLSEEFEIIYNETRLGVPLGESLTHLHERINSPDVKIFCTALTVQASVGGNLIEVLANIADTVRARLKIKKEIRSKTASGKISGVIVGILPVVLFLFLKTTSPDYIDPFLASAAGKITYGATVVLIVIGVIIIRKIVDIEY